MLACKQIKCGESESVAMGSEHICKIGAAYNEGIRIYVITQSEAHQCEDSWYMYMESLNLPLLKTVTHLNM